MATDRQDLARGLFKAAEKSFWTETVEETRQFVQSRYGKAAGAGLTQ
jgi:hypothetical protein